jgi:hypothetical protein
VLNDAGDLSLGYMRELRNELDRESVLSIVGTRTSGRVLSCLAIRTSPLKFKVIIGAEIEIDPDSGRRQARGSAI